MIHFLKFFLFILFITILMIFFISNAETVVILKFNLPVLTDGTVPVLLDYLVLGAFLSGILLAACMGALRFSHVRREWKKIKELKENNPAVLESIPAKSGVESDELPSLR